MLRKRSKEYCLTKVQEVIDFSNKNPFVKLFDDQAVKEALEPFSHGIHRILIMKRDSNMIVGVLSQVDVVKFCVQCERKEFEKPVSQLKHKTENLVTVPQESTSFDSFVTMREKGLSSVGVLNHLGQLIGNLSAADLRMCAKDLSLLLRSTKDYLKMIRKAEGKPDDFIVACSPETTLMKAGEMMAREKVHRIYMIDPNKKPIAVISFTDIVKEIFTTHT